jgi:hypothetical protein
MHIDLMKKVSKNRMEFETYRAKSKRNIKGTVAVGF